VPKTEEDHHFEAYLVEHGYDPGEHEPDLSPLGVGPRPDYLPTNAVGERIVCEVKGFGVNNLTRRLRQLRMVTVGDREQYGPIRSQVKKAARKLKPLAPQGLPLVVVLARALRDVVVDLSVENVTSALFGDPGYVLEIDRETGAAVRNGRHLLGRDGALTRDHQHVSAVAILEGRTFTPGFRYRLDVIEALSSTATPLPDHWFAGPRDSRWRWSVLEDGGRRLERAWGPDDAGLGDPEGQE
jgi:hypothetical protein